MWVFNTETGRRKEQMKLQVMMKMFLIAFVLPNVAAVSERQQPSAPDDKSDNSQHHLHIMNIRGAFYRPCHQRYNRRMMDQSLNSVKMSCQH